MNDALKDLIARDEWLEVAKAITFAYVNAPANPKKYAWVSAVEEGPYHIETNDSAANGGQGFKAICGAAGDFNAHKLPAQIFPSQKCKSCLDLAGEGGTLPNAQTCAASGTLSYSPAIQVLEVAGQGKGQPSIDSLCVGNGGGCPSHSPLYLTAAEIVDQVELLQQYRMEELAAAEEGAAIEASNMPYPEYERNGR
jgi:hypothetical protein